MAILFFGPNFGGHRKVHMIGQTEKVGFWRQIPQTAHQNILVVVYKGECTFLMNGTEFVLFPGDLFFIPQGQTYQAKTTESNTCRFYFIHFTPESCISQIESSELHLKMAELRQCLQDEHFVDISLMPRTFFQNIVITNKIPSGESRNEIYSLLENSLSERNHLSISSKFMITLYVSQILALATKITLGNLFSNSQVLFDKSIPLIVQEALQYIRQHYRENITLKDLCLPLKVSPQYFIRVFNKTFGRSPVQYINNLRIAYAKDLIRYSHMSLKDVSFELFCTINPIQ
jgi:YesN/AraC family two-component response regulator